MKGSCRRIASPVALTGLMLLAACGGSDSGSLTGTIPTLGAASGAEGGSSSEQGNQSPMLSAASPLVVEVGAALEFAPVTSDPDSDDTLTFSIDNRPSWARFDTSTGELSGTPDFTAVGSYPDVQITVTDSEGLSDRLSLSIEVTMDEVELAIASGDASVVADAALLEDALIDTIREGAEGYSDALIEIFELAADGTARAGGSSLTSVDWDPTHDTALLAHDFGENVPLLTTNAVTREGYQIQEEVVAVLGERDARYLVMGSNPMRHYVSGTASLYDSIHRVLANGMAWLTRRDELDEAPLKVVMAHLGQSYYFRDEVRGREWLDDRLGDQVTYHEADACDDSALAGCLSSDVDLLILSHVHSDESDPEQIAQSVAEAMTSGIPVLYMHHDGGESALSKALFPLFDVRYVGDNYWRRLQLADADPSASLGAIDTDTQSVLTLVEHFRNDDLVIDWDDCDGENCSANADLVAGFWGGAGQAQAILKHLDQNQIDIFLQPGRFRFKKLLALLGDHYRGSVSFPMDRRLSPDTVFLQALYADHATYQHREKVGTWSDLGNFSRTDFSHITPTSRTVRHVSKRRFRSTGAYALPGKTVSATRNDNSDVGVKVKVNTLRNGSTHTFAESGYTRPRELQTPSTTIEPGETIRFTSAIGGPLQLEYDANDQAVEIVFENIGEHPYWSEPADNERFTEKLYAGEFDWAEIVTPAFEVHSTREKMVRSLENAMFGDDGGTPQELADATMRYVHNFPHVLAGFQGPGVDVVDEIHQFAADNGLPVANLDLVKHMNADQATCGYGCSGNPYDAYWSFSPIGHGDIHELGHGLERARFRFTGWPGHSTTNFYSYYTKTQYHKETGEDPSCQSLPFKANFDVLRESFAESDPGAHVRAHLWTSPGWSEGTAMIIQMMMAAEDNGALIDGWHLLARMHIVERAYQTAVRNDEQWLSLRDGLGMSLYERSDARAMSPEDWLLIVVSHVTGFDHRAYFDVWGHAYTDTAADQVAAMSLTSMPLNYYVTSPNGFCRGEGFDGSKIALDGVATWPDESVD